MMWWRVVAVVVAIVAVAEGAAEAAETAAPVPIDLRMKTEARVPDYVLDQSKEEVARIFAVAGLAVQWTETEPRITVTLLPQVLGYATASSPVMGVARRSAAGSTVQVFFRQVQDFARAYDIGLGTMLAHVIAHEVGHLLLPTNAHSHAGLMQPAWDKALVRDARRGSLTFTEAQAATIRASR